MAMDGTNNTNKQRYLTELREQLELLAGAGAAGCLDGVNVLEACADAERYNSGVTVYWGCLDAAGISTTDVFPANERT